MTQKLVSGMKDFGTKMDMGIISYIKAEAKVIRERDPAIKSNLEIILYPGFRAVLYYRLAHKLYRSSPKH